MKLKQSKTPDDKRKSIKFCLNMIVKNEAHIIKRCLHGHEKFIDAIAIVDTGSTDDTIKIISSWAEERKIPASIKEDRWIDDFAFSRNQALDHGGEFIQQIDPSNEFEWFFVFADADNEMVSLEDLSNQVKINREKFPDADTIKVEIKSGQVLSYRNTWMVRYDPTGKKKHRWYYPCHEVIMMDQEHPWQEKTVFFDLAYINSKREGDRSKDPFRYLRDALAFEKALIKEPFHHRFLYYLGQSYFDAAVTLSQQKEIKRKEEYAQTYFQRSEEAYLTRASKEPFNHWYDEYTYLAWLKAFHARVRYLKEVDATAVNYLFNGFYSRPSRLEIPFEIVKYYLAKKLPRQAWEFAKRLIDLPYPKDDIIFVDQPIHQYHFNLQASLAAFYAGDRKQFAQLSLRVIKHPNTPEHIKKLATENYNKWK